MKCPKCSNPMRKVKIRSDVNPFYFYSYHYECKCGYKNENIKVNL